MISKDMVVRDGKYLGFKKTCPACGKEIVAMIEFTDKIKFMEWLNSFNNIVTCTYCFERSPIENV